MIRIEVAGRWTEPLALRARKEHARHRIALAARIVAAAGTDAPRQALVAADVAVFVARAIDIGRARRRRRDARHVATHETVGAFRRADLTAVGARAVVVVAAARGEHREQQRNGDSGRTVPDHHGRRYRARSIRGTSCCSRSVGTIVPSAVRNTRRGASGPYPDSRSASSSIP